MIGWLKKLFAMPCPHIHWFYPQEEPIYARTTSCDYYDCHYHGEKHWLYRKQCLECGESFWSTLAGGRMLDKWEQIEVPLANPLPPMGNKVQWPKLVYSKQESNVNDSPVV